MKLVAKVAIVTGGTKGIGLEISRAFAQEGATVVMASVDDAGVRESAIAHVAQTRRGDGEVTASFCDVSDSSQVEKLVDSVATTYGRVDILVNNAGISGYYDFFTVPLDIWERVLDVNYKGAFLCSRAAARVMIDRGIPGRIITTTSMGVFCGTSDQFHYAPAKAAAHNLMMSLAVILGPYGITCNSVAPGPILTDMNRQWFDDPEKRAYVERRTVVGRLGNPNDVVGAYLYLASDDAPFTTGAHIRVDGGVLINLV